MDFPESVKLEAKRRAHYQCVICRRSAFLHVHHITPQGEDGPADLDNAAPLCVECHDLYGNDRAKRKWVREARDFWWEFCAKQESHSDAIALRARIDQLQTQITLGHQELLSEFKSLVVGQLRSTEAAVSSARTVEEVAQASSTTSLRGTIRGPTSLLDGVVYPSLRSKGPEPPRPPSEAGPARPPPEVPAPHAWRYPRFLQVAPLPPEHERVYVRHGSPRELLAEFDSIPPLQQRKVANEIYAGRWIRFPAVVKMLRAEDEICSVLVSGGDGTMVHVTLPADRVAQVEQLRAGDRVTVDGQIRVFDDFGPSGAFELVYATIAAGEERRRRSRSGRQAGRRGAVEES
jgi:HNH endonuclease